MLVVHVCVTMLIKSRKVDVVLYKDDNFLATLRFVRKNVKIQSHVRKNVKIVTC